MKNRYSAETGIWPVSVTKANKRARRYGCQGRLTIADWFTFHETYNQCLACGVIGPVTLDHVVPLSLKGDNQLNNLQGLCYPCNCAKGQIIRDYRIKGLLPEGETKAVASMKCRDTACAGECCQQGANPIFTLWRCLRCGRGWFNFK